MNKGFLVLMLMVMSSVCVQQAVAEKAEKIEKVEKAEKAEKVSHKEYAGMAIKECNECHKSEGVALNHDADWERGHRLLAQKGGANCIECHDQAYCLDCHQGGGIDPQLSTQNYKRDYIPKSHRTDWLEIHPIKAVDNPQRCTRCHEDQKYCIQCHQQFAPANLEFLSHRRQFQDIKLSSVGPAHSIFVQNGVVNTTACPTCHPNGIVPSHIWSSDHAREARRNLQSCQTCHSNGDVCMTCHSARTGLRVNPHPRDWNSVKGNYRTKSDSRTCLQCHNPGTF